MKNFKENFKSKINKFKREIEHKVADGACNRLFILVFSEDKSNLTNWSNLNNMTNSLVLPYSLLIVSYKQSFHHLSHKRNLNSKL